MGLRNRRGDLTPFDMEERPVRQHPLLMPLLWGAAWMMTRRQGLRCVERIDMDRAKPPYLVLATHQGFSDYLIAPRALFPHRAVYLSDMEGFAGYGKWLYRHGGCIGKRRYVPDIRVMSHLRYALHTLGQSVVIFPEARHCDAGITSPLPDNLGQLCRVLGVPVAVLRIHGSYLANPLWDEAHTRRVRMQAQLRLLWTAGEVRSLPDAQMQRTLEEALAYDEYAYQAAQGIRIDAPRRAQGLHLPLYRCRACGAAGKMSSVGAVLSCGACGAAWTLDPLGSLLAADGQPVRIPEWYAWERRCVEEAVSAGTYAVQCRVRVEALPNEHGFIPLGNGTLHHDAQGFRLRLDTGYPGLHDAFPLHFPPQSLPSCQTEYNYRGRGACIVLSTPACCYYVYALEPGDPDFRVTEMEFAAEALHRLAHRRC